MASHPYTLIPGKRPYYRPYLRLRLGNPQTKKLTPPIRGLIDSGADICLAAKELALWLGLKFSGNEETFTVITANGTTCQAVRKTVLLITEEGECRCPFFFAEGIPLDAPPLLGHLGFFDRHRICFDLKKKLFEIFRL